MGCCMAGSCDSVRLQLSRLVDKSLLPFTTRSTLIMCVTCGCMLQGQGNSFQSRQTESHTTSALCQSAMALLDATLPLPGRQILARWQVLCRRQHLSQTMLRESKWSVLVPELW